MYLACSAKCACSRLVRTAGGLAHVEMENVDQETGGGGEIADLMEVAGYQQPDVNGEEVPNESKASKGEDLTQGGDGDVREAEEDA